MTLSSRSRTYSVVSRMLAESSFTFEDSRISGIPSGMKGVLLFIVSPIAVKPAKQSPKSTVSEKERSYRGEPHTIFNETPKDR